MPAELEALVDRTEQGAIRFGEGFLARVRLDRDRGLAEELSFQTRPLIQALLESAAGSDTGDRPELREALTLASLLGRRAAALGATPSATLHIAPALADAVDVARPHVEPLREVIVEGYVAEREEAMALAGAERAAGAIPVISLAPGCFVWLPQGDQAAEQLEAHGEELARKLLEGDARALVVYARGLLRPDRERAGHLFAIHASCMMLGVVCVFAGVGEGWADAAAERGIDLGELRLRPSLDAALELALSECDYTLGPRPRLERAWRRLVGKG